MSAQLKISFTIIVSLRFFLFDLSGQNFEYALSQQEFAGSTISTLLINKDRVILGGGVGSCMTPAFWVFDSTGQFISYHHYPLETYEYASIKSMVYDTLSGKYFMLVQAYIADDVPGPSTIAFTFDNQFNLISQKDLFPELNNGVVKILLPFLIAEKSDSVSLYNQEYEEIFRFKIQGDNYRTTDAWILDSSFILLQNNSLNTRVSIYNWQGHLTNSKDITVSASAYLLENRIIALGTDHFLRKYSLPDLQLLDSLDINRDGTIIGGNGHSNTFEIISRNDSYTTIDIYDSDLNTIKNISSGLEGESEIQGMLFQNSYYHTGKFYTYQPDSNWSTNLYAIIPFLRKINLDDFTINREDLKITKVKMLSHPEPSEIYTSLNGAVRYHYSSMEPAVAEVTVVNETEMILNNFVIYKDIQAEINCVHYNAYHYVDSFNLAPGDSVSFLDTTYLHDILASRGLNYYVAAPNHQLSDSNFYNYTTGDIITSLTERKSVDQIAMYPNPVSDFISLECPKNLQESAIEIISVNGSIMKFGLLSDSRIDVRSLNPGIYYLRLRNQTGIFLESFINIL